MEAAKRGVPAPQVQVVCERCGGTFSRSAYHPYVKHCRECRKVRKPKVAGKQMLVRVKETAGVILLKNLSTGQHYGLSVDGVVVGDRMEREEALAEFRRLCDSRLHSAQG